MKPTTGTLWYKPNQGEYWHRVAARHKTPPATIETIRTLCGFARQPEIDGGAFRNTTPAVEARCIRCEDQRLKRDQVR